MGNHHAPETSPTGTPSPLYGSLYVTACEVRYNDAGEWTPLLFPSMDEEQAQRMADYLDTVAPEGMAFVPEYRNIRVAHCMFSELPEYNDTDPLT